MNDYINNYQNEFQKYLEKQFFDRTTYLGIFLLIGVFATLISLTDLSNTQDEIEVAEIEPRCSFDNEYYSSYSWSSYNGCMPNALHATFYNSLGYEEIDTKQIVGRIVQIESGDHITLESGERYAISNGIDEIWIDDLVTLHKIEHRAIECEIGLMNFYNGTSIVSDVYNFKKPDIVMTKQELIDHFYDYKKLVDDKYGGGIFESRVVRDIFEEGCEKDFKWEIEKID